MRSKRGTGSTPHFSGLIVPAVVEGFIVPALYLEFALSGPASVFNFCSTVLSFYILYFVELIDLTHPFRHVYPPFFGKAVSIYYHARSFWSGRIKTVGRTLPTYPFFSCITIQKTNSHFLPLRTYPLFFLARIRTVGLVKCWNLRYTAP